MTLSKKSDLILLRIANLRDNLTKLNTQFVSTNYYAWQS